MSNEAQAKELPVWLTIGRFARELDCSTGHVKNLIKRGVYTPTYFGKRMPRLPAALLTTAPKNK